MRFFNEELEKLNIYSYRIRNLKIIFYLLIGYGYLNNFMTGIYFHTYLESIAGFVAGSLGVYIIFNDEKDKIEFIRLP